MSCRSKFELFYHYIPFLTFRNYFRGGRGGRERGEEWGRERGERGKERGAGEEKEGERGRGKGGTPFERKVTYNSFLNLLYFKFYSFDYWRFIIVLWLEIPLL